MFITGYFARASDNRSTLVHVTKDGKSLCGYRPHKSYTFQWCAMSIHFPYISCEVCKRKAYALEVAQLTKYAPDQKRASRNSKRFSTPAVFGR